MKLSVVVTGNFSKCLDLKNNFFNLLKNKKCVDGVIWKCLGGDQYQLHLFEMKKTITHSTWKEVKIQYHGTFLRCRMVADLLGVRFDSRIHLHTVFCTEDNTDLAMIRIPTDEQPNQEEQGWCRNRYDLPPQYLSPHWGELNFQHHKVKLENLNAEGIPEGNYDLNHPDKIV